jgi:hypothetical protein
MLLRIISKHLTTAGKTSVKTDKPSILATHLVLQTLIRRLWFALGSISSIVLTNKSNRFGEKFKNSETTRTCSIMLLTSCSLQQPATQRFKMWELQ